MLIVRTLIPHSFAPATCALTLLLVGCGGTDLAARASKDFKGAIDPTGIEGLQVSCAHDQGNEFTCKVSGGGPQGPGIYAVTDDPHARQIFFEKQS